MRLSMFTRSEFCSFFFFSSRRRHTRFKCDWSSTCALPIYIQQNVTTDDKMAADAKDLLYVSIRAIRGQAPQSALRTPQWMGSVLSRWLIVLAAGRRFRHCWDHGQENLKTSFPQHRLRSQLP